MFIQIIRKSFWRVEPVSHTVDLELFFARLAVHGQFDATIFKDKGICINTPCFDGSFETTKTATGV